MAKKNKNKFNEAALSIPSTYLKVITGVSALILSLLLLIAAYGKLFYPSEGLYILDYIASVCELVLLANLILYCNRWKMWLIASSVFATWGGYSFFWYQVELPCFCMGASLDLPSGLSLIINGLFYALSMTMVYLLKASRQWFCGGICSACLLAIGGFFFAQWVYHQFVLN